MHCWWQRLLSIESTWSQLLCNHGMGMNKQTRLVIWGAITGTTILVLYLYIKSLQLIWRPVTHRFHLRVPDVRMRCRHLVTWQGARIIATRMATGRHHPSHRFVIFSTFENHSNDVQFNITFIFGRWCDSTDLTDNLNNRSRNVPERLAKGVKSNTRLSALHTQEC